jgi:hypothetical protein
MIALDIVRPSPAVFRAVEQTVSHRIDHCQVIASRRSSGPTLAGLRGGVNATHG